MTWNSWLNPQKYHKKWKLWSFFQLSIYLLSVDLYLYYKETYFPVLFLTLYNANKLKWKPVYEHIYYQECLTAYPKISKEYPKIFLFLSSISLLILHLWIYPHFTTFTRLWACKRRNFVLLTNAFQIPGTGPDSKQTFKEYWLKWTNDWMNENLFLLMNMRWQR